ncbi:MAG: sigma factor-like helix-turn-helix DNA-binding protein [Acidimicrobiales bacterium]
METGAVGVWATRRRQPEPPEVAEAVSWEVTPDFVTFYREARDEVARALTVTLADADLAAEATDEAMARAYQHWGRIGSFDNPGGWVYRVGLNWATSVLRRRRRPNPTAPPGPVEMEPMGEPDVARALAELDIRQRAVVVCRYLLGWSEAATAAALDTPVGTVKSRLHRASRTLSTRLSHLRTEEP